MKLLSIQTVIALVIIVLFLDAFAIKVIEFRDIMVGWAAVLLTNVVAICCGIIAGRLKKG